MRQRSTRRLGSKPLGSKRPSACSCTLCSIARSRRRSAFRRFYFEKKRGAVLLGWQSVGQARLVGMTSEEKTACTSASFFETHQNCECGEKANDHVGLNRNKARTCQAAVARRKGAPDGGRALRPVRIEVTTEPRYWQPPKPGREKKKRRKIGYVQPASAASFQGHKSWTKISPGCSCCFDPLTSRTRRCWKQHRMRAKGHPVPREQQGSQRKATRPTWTGASREMEQGCG